jgi:tRNA pseudouridine38-40 synthase
MRIALGVEYDGAGFCGWQSQPAGCGVQDVLEKAIAQVAQHPIRIHAAGRTDTGVHALMQIIHFDVEVIRPETAWVRGVNAFLPPTVRAVWSKPVPEEFHARFSAQKRSYEYLLINTTVAPAVLATKAGWYHQSLRCDAMQQAIQYLIGEHDFSAFRASECQAKSPIRHMYDASINSIGNRLVFRFKANAFLQHQVRNMIGALIYVGNGKHPPAFISELLKQHDRTLSPPTFSANGLYLTGVEYDAKWQLPAKEQHMSLI